MQNHFFFFLKWLSINMIFVMPIINKTSRINKGKKYEFAYKFGHKNVTTGIKK